MSPLKEQLVVDFKELNLLGLVCGNCETEVVMDMATEKNWHVPVKCPACSTEFEVMEVRSKIDGYRSFYRSFAQNGSNHKIRIRVSILNGKS